MSLSWISCFSSQYLKIQIIFKYFNMTFDIISVHISHNSASRIESSLIASNFRNQYFKLLFFPQVAIFSWLLKQVIYWIATGEVPLFFLSLFFAMAPRWYHYFLILLDIVKQIPFLWIVFSKCWVSFQTN